MGSTPPKSTTGNVTESSPAKLPVPRAISVPVACGVWLPPRRPVSSGRY